MRVRILTAVGGHDCGSVIDVPDDQARAWIDRGDAEPLDSFETATSDPPENAMREKARGRK